MKQFLTYVEAAALKGLTRHRIGQLVQDGELTLVPVDEVPVAERVRLCRSYLRRSELMLEGTVAERNGWVTSREAAAILGLHPVGLKHRVKRGDLTPLHLPAAARRQGWRTYYARDEVEKALHHPKPLPIPPYSHQPAERDCVYLAGLFDGEGCVLLSLSGQTTKRYRQHQIMLRIGMTEPAAVQWVREHFGGSICLIERAAPKWKPVHVWTASASTAYHILCLLLPDLKVKEHQAKLAIEFQEHIYNYNANLKGGIDEEEFAWREAQRARLSTLNKRGL